MAAPRQPSSLLPRLLRLRDAPFYLGMDRNRFNADVRPQLTEIRIGTQGVAFDRLELDAWVDDYKSRNGRPASEPKGEETWDANTHQDCGNAAKGSGTSNNRSSASRFAAALAQATSTKRN